MAEALLPFFEEQSLTPKRITQGEPWQNGSNESFNAKFRWESFDVRADFSSQAEENYSHTNGCQGTIIRQSNGELRELPASVTTTEASITQKTKHAEWPKNGGR